MIYDISSRKNWSVKICKSKKHIGHTNSLFELFCEYNLFDTTSIEDTNAAIVNTYSLPVCTFTLYYFVLIESSLCYTSYIYFVMASGNAADVNPLKRQRQNSSFNMSSDLSKLNAGRFAPKDLSLRDVSPRDVSRLLIMW